jgi:hypothetical protein
MIVSVRSMQSKAWIIKRIFISSRLPHMRHHLSHRNIELFDDIPGRNEPMTTSLICSPAPPRWRTFTCRFERKILHLPLRRPSMDCCDRVAIRATRGRSRVKI